MDQWDQIIEEFKFIQSLYISKCIDVDNIQIPKEWLDARKAKRANKTYTQRAKRVKGEFSCKIAKVSYRYTRKNATFVPHTINLEKISQHRGLIIYDVVDNSSKLDDLFYTIDSEHKLIIVSAREFEKLEKLDIHNLMSYDKFMSGESKVWKRMATGYLINKLCAREACLFPSRIAMFKGIVPDVYERMRNLVTYPDFRVNSFLEAMGEKAEKDNNFDQDIYNDYIYMKDFIAKYPFVNTLATSYTTNSGLVHVLRDMFKFYKVRMSFNNYKKEKL